MPLAMTLAEARAVLWPFATPRRPIGELLDAGRIGEPDLQRAARVAYSRRVKSACSVLLAIKQQPAAPSEVKPITRATYPATCPMATATTTTRCRSCSSAAWAPPFSPAVTCAFPASRSPTCTCPSCTPSLPLSPASVTTAPAFLWV